MTEKDGRSGVVAGSGADERKGLGGAQGVAAWSTVGWSEWFRGVGAGEAGDDDQKVNSS